MAFTPVAPVRPAAARHSLASSAFTSRRPAAPAARAARTARMTLGKTVKETLESEPVYSTLLQLAAAGGVDLDVSNCTVFAPTNAAFARQQPGFVADLLRDPAAARAVVLRHVVPGATLTSKQIKGAGFWENVEGGPLGYEAVGPQIKIGGIAVDASTCDNECDNGTIHPVVGVIPTPMYKPQGVAQYYTPSVPAFSDSVVMSTTGAGPLSGHDQKRALGAASTPSTVGGRKAMGLMKQQPFWMYGPPFNASKQEDLEPISIAEPAVAGIDYQLMPPGSVIVTPDETSAAKLLPVSGYSKYIGKTQKMVEGDGESDYSRLD